MEQFAIKRRTSRFQHKLPYLNRVKMFISPSSIPEEKRIGAELIRI
jgi:hypothetical protein